MATLVYRTASAGFPTRYQSDRRVTQLEELLRRAREQGIPESAVRSALCRYRAC